MSDKRPAFRDYGPRDGRGYRTPTVAADGAPVPRYREVGVRPQVDRKFERFESTLVTVPAGATFTEAFRFSGRPDNIHLQISAGPIEFRFSNRGRPEESIYRQIGTGVMETAISREIVELRDPAGVGGQTVFLQGEWAERWSPA